MSLCGIISNSNGFVGFSVPNVAPEVSLTILSPTKLNVSWVPLDPEETNGHVTEYKVQWRQVPRSTSKVKEVPAKVLTFTIAGNCYFY